MDLIGVDLGGTKILARIVDTKTGKASKWAKKSTPRSGPAGVLDTVAKLVRKLDPDGGLAAVGIGVPGQALASGIVTDCPNIVGWDQPVQVKSELESRLGQAVAVSNDVNCGALAEFDFGAGRDAKSLLAVFVGTGIGGGIILDGELVTGDRGFGGEIGHMTVAAGGRSCSCGLSGHLEAYASKSGIAAEADRLARSGTPSMLHDLIDGGRLKSSQLLKAYEGGCVVTRQLLGDAADALAQVIGNTTTLLDIDTVVLGGGVIDRLGQPFVDQIASSLAFGGFGTETTRLLVGERIEDAGVLGAALLAKRMLDSEG